MKTPVLMKAIILVFTFTPLWGLCENLKGSPSISVLSWNVGIGWKDFDPKQLPQNLEGVLRAKRPDVVCLLEYPHDRLEAQSLSQVLLQNGYDAQKQVSYGLKFDLQFYQLLCAWSGKALKGRLKYKLPLKNFSHIRPGADLTDSQRMWLEIIQHRPQIAHRSLIGFELEWPSGQILNLLPVHFGNVWSYLSRINQIRAAKGSSSVASQSLLHDILLFKQLRDAIDKGSAQLTTLESLIEGHENPHKAQWTSFLERLELLYTEDDDLIVFGDYNAFAWMLDSFQRRFTHALWSRDNAQLFDVFRQKGFRLGYFADRTHSYPTQNLMAVKAHEKLLIDYGHIRGPALKSMSSFVLTVEGSDHYPVLHRIDMKSPSF